MTTSSSHQDTQRLAAHIENSPLVVVEFDASLRITHWSPQAERLFGWLAVEVEGKAMAEFPWVHEDDMDSVRQLAHDLVSGRCPRAIHGNRNYGKDGAIRHCQWYNSAIFDHNGQLSSILSLGLDITERVANEARLRESEERFRAFMDNTPVIAWAKDDQGRHVYHNRAFDERFGMRPEEWRDKTDFELWPHDIAQTFRGNDVRATADGQPSEVDETVRTPDGSLSLWHSVKFPFQGPDGRQFVGGIGVDVTGRRREEAAVKRERDLLQAVMDGAGNSHLVYLDRDFNFVRVNRSYAATCGFTPEEMIGKNHFALYPNAENEAIFAQVRESGTAVAVRDKPFTFPDQPERGVTYWDWTLTPVKEADGSVSGLVFSLFETTARKQAELEGQRLRNYLEALWGLAKLQQTDMQRLTDYVLTQIKQMTASDYAFYGAIDAAESMLTIYSWSSEVMSDCALSDRPIAYPIASAGLWGDAVRQRRTLLVNDYQQAFAGKRGLPEGHIGLSRVVVVPVMLGGKVVAVAAVANKKSDYTPADVSQLEAFLANTQLLIDRKQAEEALRQSEQLYRAIGESINYGIWICAPDGRNIYASDSFLNLVGLTQEQCANFGWGDVLHPDDEERTIAAWKECVRGEGVWDIEHRFRGVDGQWHPVLARGVPVRDDKGRVKCWAGINLDMRGIRDAELALRESEARQRFVLNACHIGAWELNLEDNSCFRSLEHGRIFGYQEPLPPWSYEKFLEHVLPEDRQEVEAKFQQARSERGEVSLECSIRRADGESRWIWIAGHYRGNGEEARPRMVGIVQDITARKALEAKREKIEAQYHQIEKAKSLGRMAGAIAHNFNNMLAVVMGSLELAMDGLAHGASIGGHLAGAMKAAGRAAEVSKMMLVYLGQTTSKHEPLDLSAACRGCLAKLKEATPESVVLEVDAPASGPNIMANEYQIQQILTNLVTNAWEAIGEGSGTVRLTIGTVSLAEIPVAHRFPVDWQPRDRAYACLEIADDGCGITEQDINMLFDPFFTTKFTGRGLGLPVVLGLVKAHHGLVTVESSPGRGSLFRVFFPALTETVILPSKRVAASAAGVEKGGTVLLVEDEPLLRQMARDMLLRLGFTVLEAKDGMEAVAVFQQHQDSIRCVLSDLSMPRLDGWQTLAALRRIRPGLPVILASGYDQAKAMAGEHAEWPQAFLGKPYSVSALLDALHQALQVT